jgi:hypothetical protein
MIVESGRPDGSVSSGSVSRKAWGVLATAAAGITAALVAPAGPASAADGVPTATVSFTTTGEHAFTVPPAVVSIHVVAVGGRGGDGYVPGGRGARVEGDVRVSPGSTIYAEVGGNGAPATTALNQRAAGGANGGGTGGFWYGTRLPLGPGVTPVSGAGGGGASSIQTCSVAACQPINVGSPALLLVAGGGGGAGEQYKGGVGGTPQGGDAEAGPSSRDALEYGLGATDTASGTNYVHWANYGPGAHCNGDYGDTFGGGGGGGGYYCGGGGGGWLGLAGAGGGGSSYGPAGTRYSVTDQQPSVTITYRTAFRLAPASRSSLTLGVAGVDVFQQAPSGANSQLWSLVAQGSSYEIVNLANGQCLTTDGLAGDQLFTWPCYPQAHNLWQVNANFGAGAGGSLIYNPAYNLYVEVYGGSTSAGGVIDAWPYNGGYANQYFLTFPG